MHMRVSARRRKRANVQKNARPNEKGRGRKRRRTANQKYTMLASFCYFALYLANRHRMVNVTSPIGHSIELYVPFQLPLALLRENSWNAHQCQRKQCSPKQLGHANRSASECFRSHLASEDLNEAIDS